ncbi:MAG: DUF3604 domain-containing protein [Planctomycetota bacterium]|nr:DUF3604 domain-containing protein [Planctomycetota bacterium]
MKKRLFLDPREGEVPYPQEPIYTEFLVELPSVKEYRFAGGRTEFEPSRPLIVGCCYDVTFKYFPEEVNLPAGTRVAFSIPKPWTQPKTDVSKPGFVSAERATGDPCKVSLSHNNNLQWWVIVEIVDTDEPQDGWVRIRCQRMSVQRFPQNWFGNWRSAMRTVVDMSGKGRYACVPANRTTKPEIIAAPPARFHVAAPAVARPGDRIEVRFSTLDYCDNLAWPAPEGEVFAADMEDPFSPKASVHLEHEHKGNSSLRMSVPHDCRSFRVLVSNVKDNLRGVSPVTVVDDRADTLNVYFGDLHAKTMLSDGLKTPMEYFEHARDVALTDFGAIADHNGAEASRIEGPFCYQMPDEAFAEIQHACEAFNKPGQFVTLQGFEQNEIADYHGHRNIYFRGICPGLFRGRSLEELYAYLEGHQALVIPHHTIIWKTQVHLDNPRYERIVEMYSMHCSSEVKGTPLNNYATTPNKVEDGISAQEILNAGYRVAFIAASDNHNGAPGLSARPSRFTNLVYSGGLAAVLAPKLTRESIFDGLYNRRCYATTGARIYLDFRLNGQLMGSEIVCERGAKLPYEITVGGADRIARIEMICNGHSNILWKYNGQDYVQLQGELEVEDQKAWRYVKVVQIDRHMAWSSPIWVDVR